MTSYWILKSEPAVYSIYDLQNERIGRWDGVRNYQARNFMRTMQKGDLAFFYHSSCKTPGIHGLMEVHSAPYLDPTEQAANWSCVDMLFKCAYKVPLSLCDLKKLPLGQHPLVTKGNRLSVMPLTEAQFRCIQQALEIQNQ